MSITYSLDDVVAELESIAEYCHETSKSIHNNTAMYESMAEVVKEAIKDKERLDFLASTDQNICNVQMPTDIVERNVHSMRDAIDDCIEYDQKLARIIENCSKGD